MDITSLTAVELGKKIKAKEISVVEAVKASIAQIEKATAYTDPQVLSESKKIFSGIVSLDKISKRIPDLSKTKLGLPNQNKTLCIA